MLLRSESVDLCVKLQLYCGVENCFFAMTHAARLKALHVHLCGCNGMPAVAYQPLLDRLGVGSTSFTEVGHLADRDWHRSIDAVVADVQSVKGTLEPGRRLVGFGHSLGGALTYAAAVRSRDTYDAMLIFDPPMFRPLLRAAMFALQRSGSLFDLHPLIKGIRKRPATFPSRQAAKEFLQKKRLYRSMHPDVINAYVRHALVDDPDQEGDACRFLFGPEEEASFIRSTPTELFKSGLLGEEWMGQYDAAHCPGTLIYSSRHEFNAEANVDYLKSTLRYYDSGSDPTSSGSGSGSGSGTSSSASSSSASGSTRPLEFRGEDVSHFHPLVDPDQMAEWIIDEFVAASH